MAGNVTPLLRGSVPEPKKDALASYENALLTTVSNFPRYNPDLLVQKKGLATYARMLDDEQVKAVSDFKRDAVLSRGWSFNFDSESKLSDDEKKNRIELMQHIVKQIRGSFVDCLDGILVGADMGFSLTEKVYSDLEFNGRTYTGISKLVVRDTSTFMFYTDPYGELDRFVQMVGGREVELDLEKFIHYVNDPKYDPYFGRSQLKAAYRSWYIKDVLVKLQAMYSEKFAGFIKITVSADSAVQPASADWTRLEDIAKNLKTISGIVLPAGVDAELVFPTTTDVFSSQLLYHDRSIAKALLVPNLLGLSNNEGGGSLAQSATHLEAFFWTLKASADRLASTLNEQLFYPLGELNWGDGDYPCFEFKAASLEHAKWTVETFLEMTKGGAAVATETDEKFLRQLMELPERTEQDKPVVHPTTAAEQSLAADSQQAATDQNQQKIDIQQQEADTNAKVADARARLASYVTVDDVRVLLRQATDELASKFSTAALQGTGSTPVVHVHQHPSAPGAAVDSSKKKAFTLAARRVAFTVIARRGEEIVSEYAGRFARLVAKLVDHVMGDEEQMAALVDQDMADIALVRFDPSSVGKLKAEAKRALDDGWQLGLQQARAELGKAKGQALTGQTDVQMASLRGKASEFLELKGYRMAEDVADGTRRILQQELTNAVKAGATGAEAREAIWSRLAGKGYTSLQAISEFDERTAERIKEKLGLEDLSDAQATAYLDTFIRTNTFEAMNEARFAEFSDPALADFVLALEYSAILDDRTTDICQALDTDIWATDSPMWDTYRPPNHFNCRSVLIPITATDGWDGTESPEPDVNPQEGFGPGGK